MQLNDYQEAALKTCLPSSYKLSYLVAGLAAEAGEVAGKYAKYVRDDTPLDTLRDDIEKEIGDILWFIAILADYHGTSLEEIARVNILKLNSRKERGVLGGSGDNR